MITTYIKINDTEYSAVIRDIPKDSAWGGRQAKAFTLGMAYALASELFVNDAEWAIIYKSESQTEEGEVVYTSTTEDCSAYSVAGAITDNRDGTVTVKMGKPTDSELLTILMGG